MGIGCFSQFLCFFCLFVFFLQKLTAEQARRGKYITLTYQPGGATNRETLCEGCLRREKLTTTATRGRARLSLVEDTGFTDRETEEILHMGLQIANQHIWSTKPKCIRPLLKRGIA